MEVGRAYGSQRMLLVGLAAAAALLALFVLLAPEAEASHFRGGTMHAVEDPDSGNNGVRLEGKLYYRLAWPWTSPPVLGLIMPGTVFGPLGSWECGDYNYAGRVFVIDPVEDWFGVELVGPVVGGPLVCDYSSSSNGGSPWIIRWGSNARMSDSPNTGQGPLDYHVNNPDTPFALHTSFKTTNNSPYAQNFPPIWYCDIGVMCFIPLTPFDADGDGVTTVWATSTEFGTTYHKLADPSACPPNSPSNTLGNCGASVAILSNNTIRWDTTGAAVYPGAPATRTFYSVAVMLQDGNSRTPLEFLVMLGKPRVPPPPPPPPVPPPPPCSEVAARAYDDQKVPIFGGLNLPSRWFRANYLDGAMVINPTSSQVWDVQHAQGNAWGRGVWVVDEDGNQVHFLPGAPTSSATQANAALLNAGATSLFYWPGGPMFFQHFDNFIDNVEGDPSSTWEICRDKAPPPSGTNNPAAPPSVICSPKTQTIYTEGTATLMASGGNGEYLWDSSGGSPESATGDTSQSRYYVPGTFEVTVTSGDQQATCYVLVKSPPAPKPSFQWADSSPECGPRSVSFTDTSTPASTPSSGAPPTIVAWSWEFGDGGTSTDPNPTHEYGESGTYTVKLTVTDSEGRSSSTYTTVNVSISECERITQEPQEGERGSAGIRDGTDTDLAGADSDQDGIPDAEDVCPSIGDDQADLDLDGLGDACDPDLDGDEVANDSDNCLENANTAQGDLDGDAEGDACDLDMDDDDVLNKVDNCPTTANGDQSDLDGDAFGDRCDDAMLDANLQGAERDGNLRRTQGGVVVGAEAPASLNATVGIGLAAALLLVALVMVVIVARRR